MAEITITVCDVCRTPGKPVTSYTISQDERSVLAVLCADDGKILSDLLDQSTGNTAAAPTNATKAAKATKVTTRSGRAPRVTRVEDIPKRSD